MTEWLRLALGLRGLVYNVAGLIVGSTVCRSSSQPYHVSSPVGLRNLYRRQSAWYIPCPSPGVVKGLIRVLVHISSRGHRRSVTLACGSPLAHSNESVYVTERVTSCDPLNEQGISFNLAFSVVPQNTLHASSI